jgi:hypothetical protein
MNKPRLVLATLAIGAVALTGLAVYTSMTGYSVMTDDVDREYVGALDGSLVAMVAPLPNHTYPTVQQSIGVLTSAVTRAIERKTGDEITALRSMVMQLSKSILDERTVTDRLVELHAHRLNDRLRSDSFRAAIDETNIKILKSAIALLKSDGPKVGYITGCDCTNSNQTRFHSRSDDHIGRRTVDACVQWITQSRGCGRRELGCLTAQRFVNGFV